MTRAVIYSRVSTAKQVQGHGLIRQYETCMDYAEEHGYRVLEVIEDVISGAAYDRPGLWRVRRLVQAGVVDVVLIEGWDRWSRGAFGMIELAEWLRGRGVPLEICDPRQIWFNEEIARCFWGQSTGGSEPPEFKYRSRSHIGPMPTFRFGHKWKSRAA